jgi:hypothetical protein
VIVQNIDYKGIVDTKFRDSKKYAEEKLQVINALILPGKNKNRSSK